MARVARDRSAPVALLLLGLLLLLLLVGAFAHQEARTRAPMAAGGGVAARLAGIRSFFRGILGGTTAAGRRETGSADAPTAGRTFGQKRIQFMLMPMVYKMGVMMTMLTVLTVISLKGLVIGVILLVLKLAALFGKFYATFHGHGSSGWTGPQPVHVHVHGDSAHGQAYGGWNGHAGGPPPEEHYYYRGR